MTAISLRAVPPVLRLGLSILASLLLHVAVSWPLNALLKPPVPVPVVMLEAILLEPPVAAEVPEPEEEPEISEPEPHPLEAPKAVDPPVPPPLAVPPAPTIQPKPPEPQAKLVNPATAEKIKQEYYPREAIARGLEGDVVVLLILKPSGAVTGAMVATSSGHAILDEAALAAAMRITRLPAGLSQLLLPVQFRLD